MDSLILARWQFAITTVYHFFFVPLTLGLAVLVAIMETMYVRTGDEAWKRMTKFWGKLFLINFAMGVVTGIVQEFQFGMNWSEYSRFVGDIFGAPLAIEALLAFFMESTFLGVWIFGWEKLSKRVHLAAIWLVAIGSNLSALWILIANSFMQEPVGYRAAQRPGRDDRFRRAGGQPARVGAVAARLLLRAGDGRLLHPGHQRLPPAAGASKPAAAQAKGMAPTRDAVRSPISATRNPISYSSAVRSNWPRWPRSSAR